MWQQDIRKIDYCYAILQALLLIVALSYLFYHSMWAMVPFIPLLIPYIKKWEIQQERKLRKIFQLQFQDYLQALTAALRAGYAVENAMKEARKDLAKQYDARTRIMRDTARMERLLDMNMPVDQVWLEWSKQAGVEELSQFTTVFMVAKRSGGDSIAIIRNAINHICDTLEVEKDIQVVLAGKRMEFQIMSFVPMGIIFYMKWSFSEFMSVLYGNFFGGIVMSVCMMVYALAFFWGYKMIQIEV